MSSQNVSQILNLLLVSSDPTEMDRILKELAGLARIDFVLDGSWAVLQCKQKSYDVVIFSSDDAINQTQDQIFDLKSLRSQQKIAVISKDPTASTLTSIAGVCIFSPGVPFLEIARAAEKLSLIPYETLLEQQKRKFPRYNVSLSVSVLSQNGMAEAQPAKIHNISMGGVFLEVDKITIAAQDVLVVEILFKGKLHKIKVKKCWEKNLSVQRSLRGIGLQFDSLDAVTQSFVEEYIRETSQT